MMVLRMITWERKRGEDKSHPDNEDDHKPAAKISFLPHDESHPDSEDDCKPAAKISFLPHDEGKPPPEEDPGNEEDHSRTESEESEGAISQEEIQDPGQVAEGSPLQEDEDYEPANDEDYVSTDTEAILEQAAKVEAAAASAPPAPAASPDPSDKKEQPIVRRSSRIQNRPHGWEQIGALNRKKASNKKEIQL
jgi:hypothetical protein